MSDAAKGHKNNLGHKHSDKSKEKISIASKGRIVSEETRKKIKEANIGRVVSVETRRKIGKKNKGKRYYGRKLSNETKNKISETKKMRNYAGSYEIYDNNNNSFHKFHGNIKNELKRLDLPRDKFCDSYRENKKIKHEVYSGWYVIKLP